MKKLVLIALLSLFGHSCYAMDAGLKQLTKKRKFSEEKPMELEAEEASLAGLPLELKVLITVQLADSIEEARGNISNLARVNRNFYALVNDELVAVLLINELSNRFGENKVPIAALLGTPGAIAWINDMIETTDEGAKAVSEEFLKHLKEVFFEGSTEKYRVVILKSLTRTNLAKALINAGADINAGVYGKTPLHCAIRANNAAMVQALIDAGADVDAKDTYDSTPLYKALILPLENFISFGCMFGIFGEENIKIVKALIQANADVNAVYTGLPQISKRSI